MPPRRRAPRVADPIAQRIAEAEKKLQPVRTEKIGMTTASYEKVADIVERGALGRKFEVLREALATGIDILWAEATNAPLADVPLPTPPAVLGLVEAYRKAPPPPVAAAETNDGALPDDAPDPEAPPGFVYKKGVGYVPGQAVEEPADEDDQT